MFIQKIIYLRSLKSHFGKFSLSKFQYKIGISSPFIVYITAVKMNMYMKMLVKQDIYSHIHMYQSICQLS